MGIEHIFGWYQQKIGTYDKQRWETKIEQREQRIFGLNHVQTRSTKPNTDLIDLDLVRGSSFTKAKPQHGFLKVTKLATLRCIFFPLYSKWWIKQTSRYVFVVSLLTYIAQVVNLIYFINPTSLELMNSDTHSFMEICVPAIMMWMLSLIHSQIVATSPSTEINGRKVKRRVFKKRASLKKSTKLVSWNDKDLHNPSNENKTAQDGIECGESATVSNSKMDGSPVKVLNGKEKFSNGFVSSDSESEVVTVFETKRRSSVTRKKAHIPIISVSSLDEDRCGDTDEEDVDDEEEEEVMSSPGAHCDKRSENGHLLDLTSSATDWMGVTTNSEEECSYSSDMDENLMEKESSRYDNELAPTAILNPPSVKVCCTIWERNEIKKADLSMLDISSTIIGKVDSMPESMDYFYVGVFFSTLIALLPLICRIYCSCPNVNWTKANRFLEELYANITTSERNQTYLVCCKNALKQIYMQLNHTFNGGRWDLPILLVACVQRWILAMMIFFLLTIAERTFKQRVLYAKLFSHLTSSRRARKSELPHFRLNKVINIKTWLSVRSYLKKRGPQRSVDVIVSTAFIVNLLLLTFLCVEVLKESVVFSLDYMETLIWCLGLGIFLLRFMTLGTKINRKYRNLSVLITEQINLHLQIEQKPHKKDELNVANNVLKLAIDLLKELENPFKISGLSANPILYNVTKLVILSALSGVFSEILGFKLKLHKIKLK